MKKFLLILTTSVLISITAKGQNLFFIGEYSYPCTETITLQSNSDDYFINDLNVLFAKDGQKALFVVGSETNNVLFHGKLIVYLDDGTVITLIDKGIYDYVDNIASAVYYLKYEELNKLKKSNINTVRYRLEGERESLTRAFGGDFSASNKGGINTKKLISDFVTQEYVSAKRYEEPMKISQKNKGVQEQKKTKLDELMGGIGKSDRDATGSEGNDNQVGDKGQPDGDPYANSYYGDPGIGSGGVGYGLNGRGAPSRKVIKQECNESGLVVVRIEVDRNGNVTKAEPGVKGTTNNSACLLELAKKIALSHKWRPDSKAPAKQLGFVSVNFKLGQ